MRMLFDVVKRLVAANAKHRKGWRMQDQTPNQIIMHAQDELGELSAEPSNRDELADVLGCLVHLAEKLGVTEDELERRAIAKLGERFDSAVLVDIAATLRAREAAGRAAPMTDTKELRCEGTENGKTAGCGAPCVYDGIVSGAGLDGVVVERFRCQHCGRRWARPVDAPELARRLVAEMTARIMAPGPQSRHVSAQEWLDRTIAMGSAAHGQPNAVTNVGNVEGLKGFSRRAVILHFGLVGDDGKGTREAAIEGARELLRRGKIGGPIEVTDYPDGSGKIVASVPVELLDSSPPCKSFTIEQLERNEHLAPPASGIPDAAKVWPPED